MGRNGRDTVLQFVGDLVDIGARELGLIGIEEPMAREVMREIAHTLCDRYARTYMYVPADLDFELTERNRVIWREYCEDGPTAGRYTAGRVAELAAQYQLTTVQIYSVVRRMKALDLKARQPELPGMATTEGQQA